MFIMIGMMLLGVLIGYLAPKHKLKKVSFLITALIWILLFLLGIEAGSNKRIVEGLHTLGLEAVLIMLGGVMGSAVAAAFLWKYLLRNRRK